MNLLKSASCESASTADLLIPDSQPVEIKSFDILIVKQMLFSKNRKNKKLPELLQQIPVSFIISIKVTCTFSELSLGKFKGYQNIFLTRNKVI